MSADYVLRKNLAESLLEKKWLDSVLENPIRFGSGKTEPVNALNTFQNPQKRLLRKSSEMLFKQKDTINSIYSPLTTPTSVKSRGEVIGASKEIPSWNKFNKNPEKIELSLESFSNSRKATKLRNAGSTLSFNRAPLVAGNSNESFTEKKSSTLSCAQSSMIGTFNESFESSHSLTPQKSGKLRLECKEIRQGDENSDNYSPPPPPREWLGITTSDSEISDWQDQFSDPESDPDNAEKNSLDSTDSCAYSFDTLDSGSTSRMLKPMCNCTLKPNNLPPAGMLFVGWLNTKIGNRFKNFPLDSKLKTVIDWLGNPLPIVIQEPGRGGRHCDSDFTLKQALGKMLKSPSQQGIAFFIGPVNGKLSYLMKMVDLNQLCALKARDDKESEKVKAWL